MSGNMSGNMSRLSTNKNFANVPLSPQAASHVTPHNTGGEFLPKYEEAVNRELRNFGDPEGQANLQSFDRIQEPTHARGMSRRRRCILAVASIGAVLGIAGIVAGVVIPRALHHEQKATLSTRSPDTATVTIIETQVLSAIQTTVSSSGVPTSTSTPTPGTTEHFTSIVTVTELLASTSMATLTTTVSAALPPVAPISKDTTLVTVTISPSLPSNSILTSTTSSVDSSALAASEARMSSIYASLASLTVVDPIPSVSLWLSTIPTTTSTTPPPPPPATPTPTPLLASAAEAAPPTTALVALPEPAGTGTFVSFPETTPATSHFTWINYCGVPGQACDA